MADNVAITAGAGTTVRTKDRTGVETQVVIIDWNTASAETLTVPTFAQSVADASNVVEGATTDAAVTTNTTGTISGKLRGVVSLLAGGLPASLGQKAMAASSGVVIASDQTSIPINGKPVYGTGAAITCTLTSLGATSARETLLVDNTTNLFSDALVSVVLKSSAVSANDTVAYVLVAGSLLVSAAENWPDTVTGADAAITLNSPTQLKMLGVISFGATGAAAGTFKGGPWSVGAAFGGTLPQKWSVVILNSNAALTAVAGDHKVLYQGIYGA